MTVIEIIARKQAFIDTGGNEANLDDCWQQYTPEAEMIVQALEESGYRIVPVEPTPNMIYAASNGFRPRQTTDVYKAMLEASRPDASRAD